MRQQVNRIYKLLAASDRKRHDNRAQSGSEKKEAVKEKRIHENGCKKQACMHTPARYWRQVRKMIEIKMDVRGMTEEQIREKLRKGYEDYLNGNVKDAATVFERFRESHKT